MSLRRKLLAYGLVGCAVAGLSWLWIWSTEKRIERSVSPRYPHDRWEGYHE